MDSSAVRFGLAAVKNVGVSAVRADHRAPLRATLRQISDSWRTLRRDRLVDCQPPGDGVPRQGRRSRRVRRPRRRSRRPSTRAIAAAQKRQRATARGQMDLFGAAADDAAPAPPVQSSTVTPREILEWEKELLGTYMSDHPLSEVLTAALRTEAGRSLVRNRSARGTQPRLDRACARHGRQRPPHRHENGAIDGGGGARGPDRQGRISCCSRKRSSVTEHRFTRGAILDVRGRLERRGEALQIVCESVYRRASRLLTRMSTNQSRS